MRDKFIETLTDLVAENPQIMIITGDLGFGVLDDFIDKYPRNFLNAGVAEQNMTGIATGLALEGRIVFTYSIANFTILRCLEQIRNDACYHQANVNVVSVGGGFSYGSLGFSHHATEDLAIMRSIPEISVFSPCGHWEVEELTKQIINHPGTCYLRLDKSVGVDTPIYENEKFEIGKPRILKEGFNCIIIVTGGILEEVLFAAERLDKDGIATGVLSMHTIKPINQNAMLKALVDYDVIVTVEEHTVYGGLGSAVSEVLNNNGINNKKFQSIGLDAGFSSIVGSQKYLRKQYGLDSNSIYQKVLTILDD